MLVKELRPGVYHTEIGIYILDNAVEFIGYATLVNDGMMEPSVIKLFIGLVLLDIKVSERL